MKRLAKDKKLHAAIGLAGAIPALVKLLSDASDEHRLVAASALASLSHCEENKPLILSAGAVEACACLSQCSSSELGNRTARILEMLCVVEEEAPLYPVGTASSNSVKAADSAGADASTTDVRNILSASLKLDSSTKAATVAKKVSEVLSIAETENEAPLQDAYGDVLTVFKETDKDSIGLRDRFAWCSGIIVARQSSRLLSARDDCGFILLMLASKAIESAGAV